MPQISKKKKGIPIHAPYMNWKHSKVFDRGMARVEQNKKSLKLIAVPPVSHSIGPKDSKIPKFSILGAGFALPISLFVCME